MAKIRAYKLAEELGIDRTEFVDRAAAAGFELKSAMSALEPEEADLLRQKLGGTKGKRAVEEQRVERKGTTAVIRRRKKVPAVAEPAEVVAEETEAVEPADSEPIAVSADESASVEASAADGEPEVSEVAEAVSEAEPAAESASRPTSQTDAPVREKAAAPAEAAPATPDRKGRQRKRVREVVNLQEQEQFARQVTGRRGVVRRPVVASRAVVNPRARRRDALSGGLAKRPVVADQAKVVRVEGEISVGDLAKAVGVKAAQLQAKLMALGTMVSVNQSVDFETTRSLGEEMGFEVQDTGFKEEQFFDASAVEEGDDGAESVTRPPIVTVMGHVDHGKTSLLDAIRETHVVDGEAGGITQHIGAYQVESGGSRLTFIDTPGHAAFTQMRARGAEVTDLVVLVVAATDGIMPQTIEAINHAKASGSPIVVAVNKCDLPAANPSQVRQKLMEHELVPEEFGGDIACVDISAKTGAGLDQLKEMLGLQAELLELKAAPERRGSGVVLEAQLDKGRGPIATLLVLDGTLKPGDTVVVGTGHGRVRQMLDDSGNVVKAAGPAMPVQMLGLSSVPAAGDSFHVVENERVAKQIVGHREDQERGRPKQQKAPLTLEDFLAQAGSEGPRELSIVLKTDVHGTGEAIREAVEKLSTDTVKLNVLAAGVGGITENDVMLAKVSNAIIVGFHVRPDPATRQAADAQGVDIRLYQVIMEVVDDIRGAMAGLLPPTVTEVALGQAEVRELFTIPRIGSVAGSYVTEGLMRRNSRCRLIRDGVQIYEGKLGSLRRFKDDVREVQTGFECGVGIDGYQDVKVGDIIESYDLEESPATL